MYLIDDLPDSVLYVGTFNLLIIYILVFAWASSCLERTLWYYVVNVIENLMQL